MLYWLKVKCTLQVKDASPNDEGYYQKLRGHLLLAPSMVCGPSCTIPVYAMKWIMGMTTAIKWYELNIHAGIIIH